MSVDFANLIDLNLPVLNLIVRATIVYLAILLLMRISGKRQMAQMNTTEFVAILLISNAVQNSMNGGDNSLGGGLILAVTLIAISTLISVLTFKSRMFSAVFEGTPTLLIHKGKMVRQHMIKERLNERDLRILLRKQGVHTVHEIETAILEADGTLSITRGDDRPIPILES